MQQTTDFITYAGPIDFNGYHMVCDVLRSKKSDRVILVLATPGGDPHAGFRIARALQHTYDKFDALVTRSCKSAGTLIVIGASKLYLDDMSELGPLDIQVKKGDELIGRNSGLDIFQAVNYLQLQSIAAFRSYLLQLTREDGLSTRVASEIAAGITTGLFQPIAGQIDPIKLAEMQRATEIAFEYGNRLNEKSNNLRSIGLAKLVTSYPSHNFVIDRKEAKTIFTNVERPEGMLAAYSQAMHAKMELASHGHVPEVTIYTIPTNQEEPQDADSPDAKGSAASPAAGEPAVGGDRQSVGYNGTGSGQAATTAAAAPAGAGHDCGSATGNATS
jgi:hypothetical protein